MQKFEKRPITIFAEQYLGNYAADDNLPFKDNTSPPKYEYVEDAERREGKKGCWKVKTAEGWVWLHHGVWVMKNEFQEIDRHYYVRPNEMFSITYKGST